MGVAVACRVEAVLDEVDVAAERLGPRRERGPTLVLDEFEAGVEHRPSSRHCRPGARGCGRRATSTTPAGVARRLVPLGRPTLAAWRPPRGSAPSPTGSCPTPRGWPPTRCRLRRREMVASVEPAVGAFTPTGLHVDEPELAARLGHVVSVAQLVSRRERLVQHGGALFVAAAHRVHQRAAELDAARRREGERSWTCSASAAARRRQSSPASTAPAEMAARPASSWARAAAAPARGGGESEPGTASAARRTDGEGSTPRSRRMTRAACSACSTRRLALA